MTIAATPERPFRPDRFTPAANRAREAAIGRKKIVPKKAGSVMIPKGFRRIGDKALADPKVAGCRDPAGRSCQVRPVLPSLEPPCLADACLGLGPYAGALRP